MALQPGVIILFHSPRPTTLYEQNRDHHIGRLRGHGICGTRSESLAQRKFRVTDRCNQHCTADSANFVDMEQFRGVSLEPEPKHRFDLAPPDEWAAVC